MRKYLFKGLLIALMVCMNVFPTDSRIETMGKRDVFFRDDMSIFRNPANIGILGSFITGALGFVNDISDTVLEYSRLVYTDSSEFFYILDTSGIDTLHIIPKTKDTTMYDTVTRTTTPTNQWFGVVYNYSITKTIGVFGGAAFNRSDNYLMFYDSLRTRREHKPGTYFPGLRGKTDFMLGAKINNINVGAGYYQATQDSMYQEYDSNYGPAVYLDKINGGAEVGIGKHSLELFGGMGIISYSNNSPDSGFDISEKSDRSFFGGTRFFFKTNIGGGLVFVPAVNFKKLSLFDSSETRISGGVGLNLRLDRGFFWTGFEGEKYTAENDSTGVEVSGLGVRFNFGIEKSLIFKWLIVRVGGSKFISKQEVKTDSVTTDMWVENPVDDGTSKDFLGFGIGLNYQNRLRFDITLNEALPYFNPFGEGIKHSSNGRHMLLRISSTFSL